MILEEKISNYHPSMASPSTAKYPYPSSEIDVWNFVHDSLTENNYEQWRQQMHNLIEKEKLVGFIDGTTKAPPKKDSESKNYGSWKRSDDLLQKWIRTTLAEDICKELKCFRTAKGLWTKLEKWFGKPIVITSSSMASTSSSSSRNSSSAIVQCPVVSEFVKKSLSVSENNYSEWRQQMYSLIKNRELLDWVSGAVEAPAKRVTITAHGKDQMINYRNGSEQRYPQIYPNTWCAVELLNRWDQVGKNFRDG
ncbi:unnamed protein product [Camellia sinensis]